MNVKYSMFSHYISKTFVCKLTQQNTRYVHIAISNTNQFDRYR